MSYISCIVFFGIIPVNILTRRNKTTNKLKILLSDDHRVILDTLNDILALEQDIEVVGTETDCLKTIASVIKLKPDILVLDISMPGGDGFSVVLAVRQQINNQRILILTVSEKMEDLKTALCYGAQGYILKRDSIREIVQAVRRICVGEIVLSNRLINRLIAEFRRNGHDWEGLNDLQKQVLQLYETGLTTNSIANRLYVDETRIKSCLQLFLGIVRLRLQNMLPGHQDQRLLLKNRPD
jgi:DNA-binding NarL/FixJ family response regulator